MGKYQSPLVKHDLSRLEDPESRHIALSSLKNCVKQLEPESISLFLDQISEAHQDVSRPYVISLYEDMARIHQTLLVPFIPRIMEALIAALSESGSSLHVHQACAKVIAGLSRYCIDLERLSQQARDVLRLLCEPLLCVLVGKFEPVAAGAAVCLQALVESENWPHASRELVNEVCFRMTAAVSGKSTPTVAHIQLACTVARVNREVFESYGLEFLAAGKDILQTATPWTLRVAAAQLLNAVLSVVDGIALSAEIASVIDVLDKFRLDRMPKVRSAVGEALKTARACYYSVGGATTKMIFSVGVDSHHPQVHHAAIPAEDHTGIGSILLPAEYGSGGKREMRSSRRSVVSRTQRTRRIEPPSPEEVMGVDFVIVEDCGYHQQFNGGRGSSKNCSAKRRMGKGRSSYDPSRVRHTVSAEPGGYVIQEWIKVDDRFPLSGIDEGDEYDEPSSYKQQDFYSPLRSERQVVIFDEDHAATSTCKRLIEESEVATTSCNVAATPSDDPCPRASDSEAGNAGALLDAAIEAEWSVRDNPIAVKSDAGSVTPPRLTSSDSLQKEEESAAAAAKNSLSEIDIDYPTNKLADESSMDSTASNDGSFIAAAAAAAEETSTETAAAPGGVKSKVSEEMVDTFRRSWEVLETEEVAETVEAVEAVTCSSHDQLVKAISTSFIADKTMAMEIVSQQQQQQQQTIWRKVQEGVEGLLGGSVCAILAVPAAMVLIKCWEPSFGGVDMVPT